MKKVEEGETTTLARARAVFENAMEARDTVVKLSDDPRLSSREFEDVRGKLQAIKNAVDVVLGNA